MNKLPQRMTALSPEKRRLFQRLLQEKGIAASESRTIPRSPRTEPLPLSFAQQRLWFLDQLTPGDPAYNDCYAIRFRGALDTALLERAVNEVVARHESLRTTFELRGDLPAQTIHPSLTLELPSINLREHAGDEREAHARVQRLAVEEARRPFDLSRGPLLRAKLLRLNTDEHVLLLVIHHIVSDGQSLLVFFQELGALYEAYSRGLPSPLPELEVQYADFAAWEQQRSDGEALAQQLEYWKRQLAGRPPELELPTDMPRPAIQTFRGAGQTLEVPAPLVEALVARSRREEATLFMVLLACFQVLLYHHTNQQHFLVGSPVSDRTRETERLIGLFVNTLVLRADLSGNPTFRDFLARTREVCLGAYAHQELPVETLVKELKLERDLSRNPLFQVFVLQHTLPPPVELPGLTMKHLGVEYGIVRLDLAMWIMEEAKGPAVPRTATRAENLIVRLQYNTDLFYAGTIARMLTQFETLLRHVVADPDVTLSGLKEILSEVEKREQTVKQRSRKLSSAQMLSSIRRKPIAGATDERL